MATSEANKKATLKYREKNISRIALDFQKEFTEKIKSHANKKGISVQRYIKELIENDLEKEN